MLVRCSHCGYQNNEHYRFCGMCGALLRLPDAEPAARAPEPTPTPQARPQAPKPAPAPAPNLDYLLEDEPEDHGHRRRMYLALVLLAIAGVVLLWQFSRRQQSRFEPNAATAQQEAMSAGSSEKVPANAAPDSAPPAAKEASTTHDAPPLAPPANSSPQETQTSPPPEKLTPAMAAEESPVAASTTDQPKQAGTTENPGPQAATEQTPAKDVASKPAPEPKTASVKPVAPVPKVPQASSATADSTDDRLVAAGEKYLYGNGVTENCGLAQKNLRAAAQRSNARAQSILGTMYATGHCVDRDLPMAYRWFAKALHQDPSNNRIQRDLEVLWRQMTADERQLAIRP
jgi:cytoskeletal protein RodZ